VGKGIRYKALIAKNKTRNFSMLRRSIAYKASA
jgi:hypothetical protein